MLLVALALHGHAGALQRMLGPAHVHEAAHQVSPPLRAGGPAEGSVNEPAASSHHGLHMLPTWREQLHGHGHAPYPPPPVDRHELVERHHHDPADATVLTQGGEASSGLDDAILAASAGSVTALAALAGPLLVPRIGGRMVHPSPVQASRWRNFDASLPDRPPRA